MLRPVLMVVSACLMTASGLPAEAFRNPYGKLPVKATPGDRVMAELFRREVAEIESNNLTEIPTLEDWDRQQDAARADLRGMLGLDPLPPRTDLEPVVTGRLEHAEFTVEKLHFQSQPGLYVTANFYLPKQIAAPLPTIVYVCGHARVVAGGVSCGNKTAYQHHGAWFARNGYACLVLDTIQLGEIEGIHHGTYREGMWWWNSRGYTPAGVEAWNSIRALDYLETRPEVDRTRFGITGRSGGGAYSWWVAALDPRIRAACPVAGIADLRNHVVDGTVEGHCDCMFHLNTRRWDFARVAALVAPRPLLIANTDKDTLFPLDGVSRLHEKVRRIYELHGASDQLGLLITEGPHEDTQELQVPVFRWFNRFLKQDPSPVTMVAEAFFKPEDLRVFPELPAGQITSRCHETFAPLADPAHPLAPDLARQKLREQTFAGWPADGPAPETREVSSMVADGIRLSVREFESQPGLRLRFYLVTPDGGTPAALRIEVPDEAAWRQTLALARPVFGASLTEELAAAGIAPDAPLPSGSAESARRSFSRIREGKLAVAMLAPRGIGLTALGGDEKYHLQVRRRLMLLGQTLAGMQVWDVRRALQVLRKMPLLCDLPLDLQPSPEMTEVACFAAIFEPAFRSLQLAHPPRADHAAPDFLFWSRLLTPAHLLDLTRQQSEVVIHHH